MIGNVASELHVLASDAEVMIAQWTPPLDLTDVPPHPR